MLNVVLYWDRFNLDKGGIIMKKLANRDSPDLDGCYCKEQAQPHTCPYQEDVNDDKGYLCTCCHECRGDCLEGI